MKELEYIKHRESKIEIMEIYVFSETSNTEMSIIEDIPLLTAKSHQLLAPPQVRRKCPGRTPPKAVLCRHYFRSSKSQRRWGNERFRVSPDMKDTEHILESGMVKGLSSFAKNLDRDSRKRGTNHNHPKLMRDAPWCLEGLDSVYYSGRSRSPPCLGSSVLVGSSAVRLFNRCWVLHLCRWIPLKQTNQHTHTLVWSGPYTKAEVPDRILSLSLSI